MPKNSTQNFGAADTFATGVPPWPLREISHKESQEAQKPQKNSLVFLWLCFSMKQRKAAEWFRLNQRKPPRLREGTE